MAKTEEVAPPGEPGHDPVSIGPAEASVPPSEQATKETDLWRDRADSDVKHERGELDVSLPAVCFTPESTVVSPALQESVDAAAA